MKRGVTMYLVTIEKIDGVEVAPFIIKTQRRRSVVPINAKVGRVSYCSRKIRKDESKKYKQYALIDLKYIKEIERALR